MSNSAVITTTKDFINDGIGLFIRWNGGRDSVEGFLKYCELKGYPSPEQHKDGWKGLIHVLVHFFEGTDMCANHLSELCIDCLEHGVYIIDNWQIVGRAYHASEQTGYKLIDMLLLIDSCMPEKERITKLILELEASIEEVGSDDTNTTENAEEYDYEDNTFSDKLINFFKRPLLKISQIRFLTKLKIKNLL